MAQPPEASDVDAIIARGTTLQLFQIGLTELPDTIRRLTWPLAGIASEADTRVIDELLHGFRKQDNWGGLCKTLTSEGSVLYLREDHAKAREAGSPLPRGLRP